jgi:hypothetical protein
VPPRLCSGATWCVLPICNNVAGSKVYCPFQIRVSRSCPDLQGASAAHLRLLRLASSLRSERAGLSVRHVQVVRIAGPSGKGVSGGHPETSEPQHSSRSKASTADGMPNWSCASPVCVTSPFKGDGILRAPEINLMPLTDTSHGTNDHKATVICSVPCLLRI